MRGYSNVETGVNSCLLKVGEHESQLVCSEKFQEMVSTTSAKSCLPTAQRDLSRMLSPREKQDVE